MTRIRATRLTPDLSLAPIAGRGAIETYLSELGLPAEVQKRIRALLLDRPAEIGVDT